ncbi:MAG TPA: tetratricopeptide repeat protein [Leptolyngbyaceae cyanobacterium]
MRCIRALSWGCLLAGLLVAGRSFPALGATLEEQLDIRPYNATQGQARDVADQWLTVGQQQADAAQGERAIAAWQNAVEIYHALGDTVAEGLAYDRIGLTYIELGQYDQAESVLRRRLAIARDNENLPGVVSGLNNVGTLLLRKEQIREAKAAFEEGYQVASSIPSASGMGLSLSNLALVAVLENDLQTAATYYEAATNYRFRSSDSLGEANSSNSLGDVYRALNRTREAFGAYGVALDIGEELNNRALQLRAIDGFLAIYLEQESWRDVQEYLNKRAALTLTGPADIQTLRTLVWLGEYYEGTGDIETAKETYQQALDLSRTIGAKPQEVSLTNRLIELR